ncbi:MAG: sugar phosphate nucleotidyltransferase [Lentisphaeria bacterium]|jgi:mannose-1-phosphate guanylyltransferase
MSNLRVAVIMAGGSGERFWPLSRREHPKQLLNLADPHRSLLQEAVDRLLPLIPAERLFVVTARHLVESIRHAGLGLPAANILAEPCKRNTTGCLVWAAAQLRQRFGPATDPTLAVVTADHQIGNPEGFRATLDAALAAAEQSPALVTIGVPPTRPETGYGYIEIPEAAAPVLQSAAGVRVFPVRRFREKPDRGTAQQFLETGRFLWNSGMFFWRLSAFRAELAAASPEAAAALGRIDAALGAGDAESADLAFASLDDISIDFALLERARRVLAARAEFPWDDIGAWDALDRTLPADPAGNVATGDPVLIDSRNCIVYNAPGAARMAVGVVGLDDVAVIVAGDAVLVLPKHRAQDVKAVVAELRKRGALQL